MTDKNIKKNYIYNVFYQILLLVTPLITTPYVSRVLEADGVGIVSYAESIVSYFALFAAMGIPTYGQREISYHQDSLVKRSRIFWNTLILKFIIAGVALAVYLIFACHSSYMMLYLVLGFQILAVLVDVTWFFQGVEEFGKIVLRNTFFKVLGIVYIFAFVQEKSDVYVYAFGIAFFTFLGNISLWRYLPGYVSQIRVAELRPFEHIGVVLSLFIPTIAIQVYTVLDKTMIGLITESAYENGYYEQAMKVSKMPLAVVTSLGTVIVPRIGVYFQQQRYDDIQHLMYRSYRFVWMIGIPMCLGLILTSRNFVPWFFGPGFERVSDLIDISAFLILAIGISNVTGIQYFVPTGRQNLLTVSVLIGAAVNFVLNLFLIAQWQSVGAAVASIIAECAVTVSQFVMVRRELSIVRVARQSVHYTMAGLVMALGLYAAGKNFQATSLNTALLIALGIVLYTISLWLMRDEFFVSNVIKAVRKVRDKIIR